MNKLKLNWGASAALFWLLALAALAIWSPLSWSPTAALAVAVVLMVFEFVALGIWISNRAAGMIIDNRNRMSLSKLQACAWTILVFAALLVAGAFNLSTGAAATALKIEIPNDLLVAMGISAVSLAATPALLSIKAGQDPTDDVLTTAAANMPGADAAAKAGAPLTKDDVKNIGSVMTKSDPSEAHLIDLVTGDEVGNFTSPDLGKIQQLLVTLLLLGVYLVALLHAFGVAKWPIGSLPALDKSFVELMAISHASYLAYKAAPHTSTN